MSISDGGPAFPNKRSLDVFEWSNGMSLRDYFAASVLNGILMWDATMNQKNGDPYFIGEDAAKKLARHAYSTADAMLEARK